MPRKEVKHSEGRDFYDDGYNSDSDNVDGMRLDCSKITFNGRTEELKLLKSIYDKIQTERSAPVTLVSGFSGTGKSTLVKQFLNEIKKDTSKKSCFSLCGKFNDSNCEIPFSAIIEALSGFSSELLTGDKNLLEEVRGDIERALDTDAIDVFTTVAPALSEVIGSTEQSKDTVSLVDDSIRISLKNILLTFIKTISTVEHPLVIYFDDLQWIDNASLQFILSLLTDKSIRHVMFIGSYRSTEVDEEHPLSKSLETIGKFRPIKKIDLLNLSIEEMGECISDLLELHREEVQPLADAVYNKTRGNMFFSIHLLEEYERKNMLYFSKICFRWEWNIKDIQEETDLSDNVIDIVVSKIKSTPEKLQWVLMVIALTRSQIDIGSLQMLMQKTGCFVHINELVKLLDLAVLEGMLTNLMGSTKYKFAHDRIRQAAHLILPDGKEKNRIRENIGLTLLDIWFTGTREEWVLFVAAHHLNEIGSKYRDPVRMTILNLEAGERSLKFAAFSSASEYLQKGLKSLNRVKNHWKDYYDISVRLYQVLVQVELILGRYELGMELADQIYANVKNLKSALPTYKFLAQALGRQERHEEGLENFWYALELIGENRKESTGSRLVWNIGSVTRYFRNHTDEEILSLPILKSETKNAIMDFYNEASSRAYFSGNASEFTTTILRRLRITFKSGISGFAAIAFAQFAGVIGNKNHTLALRVAGLAREIFKITKKKKLECQTLKWLTILSEGWSNHLTESITTLIHARKVGIEMGDIEFGFGSWSSTIDIKFLAGKRVDDLLIECTDLIEQARSIHLTTFVNLQEQVRLRLLFLATGKEEKSNKDNFTINWEELNDKKPDSNDTCTTIRGYQSRLALAIYFREHTFVEKWVELLKVASELDLSFDTSIVSTYYSGLALSGLARTSGNGSRKYLSLAKGKANEMKKLIRSREIKDSDHRYKIMEADLLSSQKSAKLRVVKDAFQDAIRESISNNQKHDAALCNELAGEYFLGKNEINLAREHFTHAKFLYEAWGAMGKVSHLQITRATHLSSDKEMDYYKENTCNTRSKKYIDEPAINMIKNYGSNLIK